MTPLIVGFLGARKITFLQKLVPACGDQGLSPSLLINDYQNALVFTGRNLDRETLNKGFEACLA
jgi:G3E family GTPase